MKESFSYSLAPERITFVIATPHRYGIDTLTMTVNDQMHLGSGEAQSDLKRVRVFAVTGGNIHNEIYIHDAYFYYCTEIRYALNLHSP